MMSLSRQSSLSSLSSSPSSQSSSLLEINAHGLLIVSTNFTFVNDNGNANYCHNSSFLLTVEDASLQDACPTNATAHNTNNDNANIMPTSLFQTQESMILKNVDGRYCAMDARNDSLIVTKTILIPLCRPISQSIHDNMAAAQTRSLLVTLWQTNDGTTTASSNDEGLQC